MFTQEIKAIKQAVKSGDCYVTQTATGCRELADAFYINGKLVCIVSATLFPYFKHEAKKLKLNLDSVRSERSCLV